MKKIMILIVLAVVILSSTFVMANNPVKSNSAIIDNLVTGLRSDNEGLRISSAAVLTHLIEKRYIHNKEASSALIPLLSMIHKEKQEEARIISALALYRLENEIGIYCLKGAALFDNSKRVRKICRNLYCEYQINNDTEYFISTLDY
jgi:hypothetical protein